MNALILETSTEKSLLALAQRGEVLVIRFLPGGPELSKNLALEVNALLHRYNFSPDFIATGEGPGSYTGIRVGAALAQTLAYGWRIPLIGFCSLKAFAPPVDGPFAILIDARIGGMYTLLGNREKGSLVFETPLLLPLAQAEEKLSTIVHFASPHPLLIQKRLNPLGHWFETTPNASILAREVYQKFLEEGSSPLVLSYLSVPSLNPISKISHT